MTVVAWCVGLWLSLGIVLWLFHFVVNTYGPATNPPSGSFREMYKESDPFGNMVITVILVLFLPIIQLFYFPQMITATTRFFGKAYSHLKGVFSMKMKLAFLSLLFTAGIFSRELMNEAKEWYMAPPAQPSAEALKLIRSLEDVDGWYTTKDREETRLSLKRGEVRIKPDNFWADVMVNDSKCNSQFSYSDLMAINKAASLCMRRLTAKAMDISVREERVRR